MFLSLSYMVSGSSAVLDCFLIFAFFFTLYFIISINGHINIMVLDCLLIFGFFYTLYFIISINGHTNIMDLESYHLQILSSVNYNTGYLV